MLIGLMQNIYASEKCPEGLVLKACPQPRLLSDSTFFHPLQLNQPTDPAIVPLPEATVPAPSQRNVFQVCSLGLARVIRVGVWNSVKIVLIISY